MSSLSHRGEAKTITYSRELRELRTAIYAMNSSSGSGEEKDNLRVLFLCRDKKAIHRVVMAVCNLWKAHIQEPMPDLFYQQAVDCKDGDTNHVVHALLILIIAYPLVQEEFKQAPMAPYFFLVAKSTYDKHIMGLTEESTFCASAADRVCHGNIEYVMLMRQRYLSL
jgi:hypothetical protein